MRFIGGETLPQCVEAAKSLNRQGLATTIDFMGESTRNPSMAEHAKQEFLEGILSVTVAEGPTSARGNSMKTYRSQFDEEVQKEA